MNIIQLSRLYIMAVIAVFVLTVTAISFTPAAIAQNMTSAGNMTTQGTNMTDTNQTGSISQVAPEQDQEAEGDADITLNTDNQGGNTGSGGEGDVEYKP